MGLSRAQTGQGLGKAHPLHPSAVGSTLGHTKVHLRTFWGHTEEMKFAKLEDVTGTRGKQGREDEVCKRLSKHLYLWVHLNQTALKFFLMNYLGKVEYEKLDLGLYAGDVSRHSKSPFSRSAPVYHRKSEILWIILQRKPKWGVTSRLKITKQCDFGHEKQDRRQQNRAGCGTRVRQNSVLGRLRGQQRSQGQWSNLAILPQRSSAARRRRQNIVAGLHWLWGSCPARYAPTGRPRGNSCSPLQSATYIMICPRLNKDRRGGHNALRAENMRKRTMIFSLDSEIRRE